MAAVCRPPCPAVAGEVLTRVRGCAGETGRAIGNAGFSGASTRSCRHKASLRDCGARAMLPRNAFGGVQTSSFGAMHVRELSIRCHIRGMTSLHRCPLTSSPALSRRGARWTSKPSDWLPSSPFAAIVRKQGALFPKRIGHVHFLVTKSALAFPTRKVVEHLVLFKMAAGFTEEQEKDMLDHLYTLQYHYRHIIALSLGRIFSKRSKGFTHALFVRFPTQDALAGYANHPSHKSVLDQFVTPFCEDMLALDFEADVEDDIETIFRRGDFFEQGIEHFVLVKVKDSSSPEERHNMLAALAELPLKLGPSIVQLTAGQNFSDRSQGYTHGLVVRVPSEEDLEIYNQHPEHLEVLLNKVLPISERILIVDFKVDPVGTTVM